MAYRVLFDHHTIHFRLQIQQSNAHTCLVSSMLLMCDLHVLYVRRVRVSFLFVCAVRLLFTRPTTSSNLTKQANKHKHPAGLDHQQVVLGNRSM